MPNGVEYRQLHTGASDPMLRVAGAGALGSFPGGDRLPMPGGPVGTPLRPSREHDVLPEIPQSRHALPTGRGGAVPRLWLAEGVPGALLPSAVGSGVRQDESVLGGAMPAPPPTVPQPMAGDTATQRGYPLGRVRAGVQFWSRLLRLRDCVLNALKNAQQAHARAQQDYRGGVHAALRYFLDSVLIGTTYYLWLDEIVDIVHGLLIEEVPSDFSESEVIAAMIAAIAQVGLTPPSGAEAYRIAAGSGRELGGTVRNLRARLKEFREKVQSIQAGLADALNACALGP